MAKSMVYNDVKQEIENANGQFLGRREIEGEFFECYRIGRGELQPEIVVINHTSKKVARGHTLDKVRATKNGDPPEDVPLPELRPTNPPPMPTPPAGLLGEQPAPVDWGTRQKSRRKQKPS